MNYARMIKVIEEFAERVPHDSHREGIIIYADKIADAIKDEMVQTGTVFYQP